MTVMTAFYAVKHLAATGLERQDTMPLGAQSGERPTERHLGFGAVGLGRPIQADCTQDMAVCDTETSGQFAWPWCPGLKVLFSGVSTYSSKSW